MCSIHSLHHNFFSISLWSEIFSRTVCTLCRLSLKSAVKYKFWQKDLSSPSFLKKVTLIFARRAPCKPFNHGKRIAANLDKTIHLAGAAFNQGGKQWSHSARNPPNFWLLIAPKPLTPSIRLLLARTLPCFVNLGALSPFCSTISTFFSPWFHYLHGLWCAEVIFQTLTKNIQQRYKISWIMFPKDYTTTKCLRMMCLYSYTTKLL